MNSNRAEVLAGIERAAQNARNVLDNVVNERLEVLLSAELELRRELEQLRWVESYIQV